MYKKFKDKLHIGSPASGRRSPSPNARNVGDGLTRWEILLNTTQTTLAIAKESVAGLPVPGLEAAIGGLLKVLTIYQGMKANEEAIKSFNEAVVRLNDNVAAPLKAAIASQPDFVDDDLQKRLELFVKDLENLTKRTDTMASRERPKKFISSQDDFGVIQELNRELDRIVLAFISRGSIGAEIEARAAKRLAQTLVCAEQTRLIERLPRAQARHNSASRVGANPCFQGTRNGILKEISAWIDDPSTRPIFWLSGMAGIGKSTIAHTIAEQEEKKHRLGASFFFSRDEAGRRNPHLVYPTIAFQLARFDSSLREPIAQALEHDADIGLAIMQKQFEHLIAGPLAKFKVPAKTILFVLDAMDECGPLDEWSPASGAIDILSRWAIELPKISNQIGVALKVLITSRPELRIHNQFTYSPLRLISQSFVLHDIEKSVVRADIELFLTQRLADLAILHRAREPWPTVDEVHALALRSDNLFIFASTAVKFISGANAGIPNSLQHRLDRLLKPEPNETTSAFAHLDALYHQVLQDAENNLKENIPNSKETFCLVLETIVLLLDPLPSTSLAALLSLQHDNVLAAVQVLRSILVIPAASEFTEPIRFFHPSFYDFITTPGRQSGRFFITSAEGHARLAKLCLETMHSLLKRNPCSIESPWSLHSDISDLQARLDGAAPNHLRYSCRFFSSHISLCAGCDGSLEQLFDAFCESKLLMWLEMMSLLGDIDGAINSIQLLKSWCHNTLNAKPLTTDLVYDAYRVLLQYQAPLRLSSGHVYTTVLAFAPACSLTRQYGSQLHVPYVIRGKPTRWDANLITTDAQTWLRALAYFPDGKRIATFTFGGRITVWNSSTGAEISSMCGPGLDSYRIELDISGDGTRIAVLSQPFEGRSQIDIWDATTRALVSRIDIPDDSELLFWRFAASPNGRELLTLSKSSILRRWNSATGEVTSTYPLGVEDWISGTVSRCGSFIAIQDRDSLRIWKLRDDDTFTLTQVLANKIDPKSLYLPRVSILHNQRVIVLMDRASYILWDYTTGQELNTIKIPTFDSMAICNEGRRMAVVTRSSVLQIWDIESGTMLGQLVLLTSDVKRLAFSSTGMEIATISSDNTLRTWDISDILPGGCSSTPEMAFHDWTRLEASRSGTRVIGFCDATDIVGLWNIYEPNYSRLDFPKPLAPIAMSPDGSCFAVDIPHYPEFTELIIYETESLEHLHTFPFNDPLHWSSRSGRSIFSEDSRRVATWVSWKKDQVDTGAIKVWDIHQRKMLYEDTFPMWILGLAFFPDGESVVVTHKDGHLILHLLSGGDNVDTVKWRPPWGGLFAECTVPDGVHFLFIGDNTRSYLVNMKDPSQITEYVDSSFVFQFIETRSGYEPAFLQCSPMGNLYKRSGDSRNLLCWLPPTWRFQSVSSRSAVWRGSYLIVRLGNGDIGVIDIDALSK
ncbi:hypothetical protein FRC04_011882 [Tulasnella sp. 424]|nr:hypothetical protein FRC04_011882 [Tulasnella sp. 424]